MIVDAISNISISITPRVPRIKISLRFLGIFGFIFVLSLLVFYIFQITEMTRAGFLISNYEGRIARLSQESQNLNTGLSPSDSLGNLEAILSGLNYEKISKVHYLRVSGSQVAAK